MDHSSLNLHRAPLERVAALVIPASQEHRPELTFITGQQLRALQRIVRGTSASLPLAPLKATLHFNEEGSERQLPHNSRATLLAWAHLPAVRGQLQVAGDVVILGPPDGGRNRNVPAALTHLLVHGERFRIEVEHDDRPGIWLEVGDGWTSWDAAYTIAVEMLLQIWTVREIRVVPVSST